VTPTFLSVTPFHSRAFRERECHQAYVSHGRNALVALDAADSSVRVAVVPEHRKAREHLVSNRMVEEEILIFHLDEPRGRIFLEAQLRATTGSESFSSRAMRESNPNRLDLNSIRRNASDAIIESWSP
jgi:hypothetical protein